MQHENSSPRCNRMSDMFSQASFMDRIHYLIVTSISVQDCESNYSDGMSLWDLKALKQGGKLIGFSKRERSFSRVEHGLVHQRDFTALLFVLSAGIWIVLTAWMCWMEHKGVTKKLNLASSELLYWHLLLSQAMHPDMRYEM